MKNEFTLTTASFLLCALILISVCTYQRNKIHNLTGKLEQCVEMNNKIENRTRNN